SDGIVGTYSGKVGALALDRQRHLGQLVPETNQRAIVGVDWLKMRRPSLLLCIFIRHVDTLLSGCINVSCVEPAAILRHGRVYGQTDRATDDGRSGSGVRHENY